MRKQKAQSPCDNFRQRCVEVMIEIQQMNCTNFQQIEGGGLRPFWTNPSPDF